MKIRLLTIALALGATLPLAAQFNIPSDGSDGVFSPAGSNYVVDLSQATTGSWDANNSGNPGKGIYDASKWAIIFKYQSVNIPSNTTVTFINHPTYAPVVWLVQSNVVVNGVVSVSGKTGGTGTDALIPTEPGPGGFRGGAYGPVGAGYGLGPGGDVNGIYSYGNPQIIPLIGGSGGVGNSGNSGPSGGGAILIAVSNSITLNGKIESKGTTSQGRYSSGGAVRLIASDILGAGIVDCTGPAINNHGRIRIETPNLATTLITYPETIKVPPANPPIIWPPANAPTARIISIGGVAAPADPTAPLVNAADIALEVNGVQVVVETKNFPTAGTVQVRAVAKFGAGVWHNCIFISGGDFATATWESSLITLPAGFTTFQARATAP